eukprot:s4444_g3.t1
MLLVKILGQSLSEMSCRRHGCNPSEGSQPKRDRCVAQFLLTILLIRESYQYQKNGCPHARPFLRLTPVPVNRRWTFPGALRWAAARVTLNRPGQCPWTLPFTFMRYCLLLAGLSHVSLAYAQDDCHTGELQLLQRKLDLESPAQAGPVASSTEFLYTSPKAKASPVEVVDRR